MEGKFYKIRSSLNQLVLGVARDDPNPGSQVAFFDECCTDGQLWYDDVITGRVRCKLNDYCLEITPDEASLRPYNSNEYNQKWTVTDDRVCHQDQDSLVMDVAASRTEPGSPICCWEFHGGPNQLMAKEYQPAKPMYIVSQMNGKVMDVDWAKTDPGTKVIMYDKHGEAADNQLWYEDRYGIIHTKLNDFVLDFDDGHIRINPYDPNKSSQQWFFSEHTIRNKEDKNMVIDIEGGSRRNGADLVQWEYSGDSNQLWTPEYI